MGTDLNKGGILLIDDDPDAIFLLTHLFKHHKVSFKCVESPTAALACVSDTTFDVVITDYTMPEMNGFELARQLRTHLGNAKIIILTARNFSTEQQATMDDVTVEFMTKPITPSTFISYLKTFLSDPT